ncbi:AAA family ATPase [Fodinibius sediminis]|uniref:Wobble nucleotide-excising tRNase n=1 Tax=Fodinibius sediminis TaxID=1214077 RepID=A0A521FAS9_9BACT|nr:hypothetical protein [Fodinibius sediminis]SMO93285.1 Wobble nucleotide-excising tRNase [Fodinibius sediminis]
MSELVRWFEERNEWVKYAVNAVQEKEKLEEAEYSELVKLCIKEAKKELDEEDIYDVDISFDGTSENEVKIRSLKNVEGINALSPKNPLKFGDGNLCIIYGQNGSGKSGYVRILKHICGARHPGKLLPNVFEDSQEEQKCDVDYEANGNDKTINWTRDDGHIDELSTVDIYDTGSGKIYVTDENEVTYEPPLLELFSDLVNVADHLSEKIEELIEKKNSKKPSLPPRFEDTEIGKWYNELSHDTSKETIDEKIEWTEKNEEKIEELRDRVNTESPEKKAQTLSEKKSRLNGFILSTITHIKQLSNSNVSEFIELDSEASAKEQAAEAAAKKVFSSAPLNGVGSDIWEKLWEKAREYSESHAYVDAKFPVLKEGSRCVLCHQKLSEEAKERFQSFEDYVTGELKEEAIQARNYYKDQLESLSSVIDLDNVTTILAALDVDDDEIIGRIKKLYSILEERFNKLTEVSKVDELPTIPQSWDLLQEARKLSHFYTKKIAEFKKDAEEGNRTKLKSQLKELEAKSWLSDQKENIEKEVKRLNEIKVLKEAKKLTNPVALSRKKGKLAEELITQAFVKRFNTELEKLGAGWIKIELVKTRVQKGRVLHKLQLKNAEQEVPDDVLSEGENRIVTLAAFLADVTGKATPAPFVFDDPITSLDEKFEEAVVRRLVELSQNRQVIVFTHRLSLTSLIQESAKEAGLNTNFVGLRKESWGTGNPGNPPIFARRPDKVLNVLIHNRLSPARSKYEKQGREAYEPVAKSICSDFRILLERMIEDELLSDVVHRFRRAVHTRKIKNLSRITESDCKYLDSMMSKYSKYEHSQARSTPVSMPEPDELEDDLLELQDWYEEFTNR